MGVSPKAHHLLTVVAEHVRSKFAALPESPVPPNTGLTAWQPMVLAPRYIMQYYESPIQQDLRDWWAVYSGCLLGVHFIHWALTAVGGCHGRLCLPHCSPAKSVLQTQPSSAPGASIPGQGNEQTLCAQTVAMASHPLPAQKNRGNGQSPTACSCACK